MSIGGSLSTGMWKCGETSESDEYVLPVPLVQVCDEVFLCIGAGTGVSAGKFWEILGNSGQAIDGKGVSAPRPGEAPEWARQGAAQEFCVQMAG